MTIINKKEWIKEDENYIDEMIKEEIEWEEHESIDSLLECYKNDFIFTDEEIEKYEDLIIDQIPEEENTFDMKAFWENEDEYYLNKKGVA